jgi:hypothetical protein
MQKPLLAALTLFSLFYSPVSEARGDQYRYLGPLSRDATALVMEYLPLRQTLKLQKVNRSWRKMIQDLPAYSSILIFKNIEFQIYALLRNWETEQNNRHKTINQLTRILAALRLILKDPDDRKGSQRVFFEAIRPSLEKISDLILEKAIDHKEFQTLIMYGYASAPWLTPHQLEIIFSRSSVKKNTDPEQVRIHKETVRAEIVDNPRSSPAMIRRVASIFISDIHYFPTPWLLEAIAKNPRTPPDVLHHLLHHPALASSRDVILNGLSQNSSTSGNRLTELRREIPNPQDSLRYGFLASNSNIPEEIFQEQLEFFNLRKSQGHFEIGLAIGLASNRQTPESFFLDTLSYLKGIKLGLVNFRILKQLCGYQKAQNEDYYEKTYEIAEAMWRESQGEKSYSEPYPLLIIASNPAIPLSVRNKIQNLYDQLPDGHFHKILLSTVFMIRDLR